jgi:hypothetical protein
VAHDGVGGETAEASSGGEREIGAVVACKASGAFMPVWRISPGRKLHPEAGLESGNDEVRGAKIEFALEVEAIAKGERARGSSLDWRWLQGCWLIGAGLGVGK